MHGRTSVLAVLPLPRHRESAAADLAASHRALIAPVLPIEAARSHTSAISMGALTVFRVFSTPSPRCRHFAAHLRRSPDHLDVQNLVAINILLISARMAGFLPALGSMVRAAMLFATASGSSPAGSQVECFSMRLARPPPRPHWENPWRV
jgi:hypothetical protein